MTFETRRTFTAPSVARQLDDLITAIDIMDGKLQPLAEREDGTVKSYAVADSTWHRVLAIAHGSTSDKARLAIDAFRVDDLPSAPDHRLREALPTKWRGEPTDAERGDEELARLRRIEDAARWVLDHEVGWDSEGEPYLVYTEVTPKCWVALRDALKGPTE
jgi:hypothetical protein